MGLSGLDPWLETIDLALLILHNFSKFVLLTFVKSILYFTSHLKKKLKLYNADFTAAAIPELQPAFSLSPRQQKPSTSLN